MRTSSETPRPPVPAVPLYAAPDVLHLILMPTERCNFRCVYCYETFAHGRMDRPTINGLRRLLERRAPSLRALTIEWFGGEPLLQLPVIVEIQEHVQRLARQHPAMRARCSMTTNGYLLTPETLARLHESGVRTYQISVDGPAPEHDARRRRADGAGTFDQVWSNLLTVRDGPLDVRIRLRIHVDRENRDVLPGFLEEVATEFAGDERFEIYLRPVGRFGGPDDDDLPILEGPELAVVDDLKRHADELGLRLRRPVRIDACYAAAANSFVIRSTGEIAKCTLALEHPNNGVGKLRADGTASLDDAKINGWVRGLFSGEKAQLRCPMKGFADDGMSAARSEGALPVLPA